MSAELVSGSGGGAAASARESVDEDPLKRRIDELVDKVKAFGKYAQGIADRAEEVFIPGCTEESVERSVSALRKETEKLGESIRRLSEDVEALYASFIPARSGEKGTPLRERTVEVLPGSGEAARELKMLDKVSRYLERVKEIAKTISFPQWEKGYTFLKKRRDLSPTLPDGALPQESFSVAKYVGEGVPLSFCQEVGAGSFGTIFLVPTPAKPLVAKCCQKGPSSEKRLTEGYSLDLDGAAAAGAAALSKSGEGGASIEEEFRIHAKASVINGVIRLIGESNKGYLFPFADGGDLQKYIPMGIITFAHMRDLVRIFAELHLMGIAHRDIKHKNILVHEGSLYISDFGCATEKEWIEGESAVGTPFTMAPEVIIEKPYNPKSADVFSLGILLYLIASKGDLPWKDEDGHDMPPEAIAFNVNREEGKFNRPPIFDRMDNGPFKDLIVQMTAFNPEKRPTMTGVLEAMNRIGSS